MVPSNIHSFSKDWRCTGDKKALACPLKDVTLVPGHILKDGLFGNQLCVIHVNQTTTRVDDRAHSLMGLLGINMPNLYGDGCKHFTDFSWRSSGCPRPKHLCVGCQVLGECANWWYLAGNLSSSSIILRWSCWITTNSLRIWSLEVDLPWIDRDCFGTFPITNRGIHISMLLRPYRGSIFQA